MDKTRIQPVGGDHAIEIMAIGVEWAASLDDVLLSALQEVYMQSPELKEAFPQFSPAQVFQIQGVQLGAIGQDSGPHQALKEISPPHFVAKAAGFDANRMTPDGKVSWSISVRPEFLLCNCAEYDRWRNVKPKVLAALRPFMDAALKLGAQINVIGLQYQDAFRLLDGASSETTGQLFRRDSRWIPDHIFEEPSFWHCHQGWFSTGHNSRRILNNITTDVTDINGDHLARIGGQHRLFAVSFDGKYQNQIEANDVDAILEFLHEENKNVINGMLSDGALEAIGCVGGGA